jgi:Protein of unknown function (DUF1353)
MRMICFVCGFLMWTFPALADGGHFVGSVQTEWLQDGRTMRLLGPFDYVDPAGLEWPVPKGTEVDGASIPQFFWSIIGGPFEGEYRNASVIHDYYCDAKTRPWPDVHNVFYAAMLTSGVDGSKAWLMYEAVRQFGPRWTVTTEDSCHVVNGHRRCQHRRAFRSATPKLDKKALGAFIAEHATKVTSDDLQKLNAAAAKLD